MSDDEDDFTSFRAELSRERTALVQKIMSAKGVNGSRSSVSSTTSSRSEALLRSAMAIRRTTDAGAKSNASGAGHQRKKSLDTEVAQPEIIRSVPRQQQGKTGESKPESILKPPGHQRKGSSGAGSDHGRPTHARKASKEANFLDANGSTLLAPRPSGITFSQPSGMPPTSPDKGARKQFNSNGATGPASTANSGPPKQSIVKAAQVFGDSRLVESAPKSLQKVDPEEDLRAKVKADHQFVQDREQAKQAKMKEILEAKPTAEQMQLPDVQRTRKTSIKALSVFGNQDLEKEMQQNVGGLPFDPSKPQNGKASRVLGSISILAQPKVGKVLGKSDDAEDAKARAVAREAWDQEAAAKQRESTTRTLIRRLSAGRPTLFRTSSANGLTVSAGAGAAQATAKPKSDSKSKAVTAERSGTPQRRLLMRMHSSAATEDPSQQHMPRGLSDGEIKKRQEQDESNELASLLDRFGAITRS